MKAGSSKVRSCGHHQTPGPVRVCGHSRAGAPRCLHTLLHAGTTDSTAQPRRMTRPRRRQLRCTAQSSSLQSVAAAVKVPGTGQEIRWGSALSRQPELPDALDEAVGCIMASLGQDTKPDVALVFASSLHGEMFEHLVPMLRQRLPTLNTIFGCSGFGVLGGSEDGPMEVEGEHAFSLTLGQVPGVNMRVLHTLRSSIPDESASPEEWAEFVGVPHDSTQPTSFLVFADPRFVQVRDLIAGLDYAFPDANKIGSILSSGTRSKSRAMWAWSAKGPANAAAAAAATAVTRRLGRGSGSPFRSNRRTRSSDVLASFTPEEIAAAVMGVMGKSAPESQVPPQPSQPPAAAAGAATDAPARADGSPAPADAPAASGSDRDASASPEPSSSTTNNILASTSGRSEGSASDKSEDKPTLIGSLLNMMGGKTKRGAGGAAGEGGATGSEALRALKDVMRGLESGSQREGGAASGGGAVLQGGVSDVPSNGMYLYGAIVLAVQGDIQLDVITSMGYRAPSQRIWRIESVSGNNHIVTLVPEELAAEASANRQGGGPGSSGRTSRVLSREVEPDSDSDDDTEMMGGTPEVQALAAVVDMLDALTENENEAQEVLEGWDELLDTAVVAVAADNSKPASELGPEDWELLPLQEIVEEYGVLVVGDSPVVGGGVDLRRGNRVQLLVRDPKGVREDLRQRLLDYKRRDLASMLEGRALPPTFGTLLLTDVDRGMDCYERPNYESETTHGYVPTPISGVFGGAQIAPLQSSNRATAILEYSAVVGVLRAATERTEAAARAETAARLRASRPQTPQPPAEEGSSGGAPASP